MIVKNLPPEEAEARRVLSRESQHSATPSGTRLTANEDASRVDDNATRAEQHPIQESIAADERSGEKVDEAPESQSTGLEWAAAELTSPTKFNSGWRHSSLLYRCTSPSQDDFDDSVEISTTRRRSTSTTSILHPRVRALQFGDFPVALPESVEEQSAAHSGHSSSPARSVPNTAPTHHGYGLHSSSDLAITGSSQSPAGFPQQLAMPFAAQMPVSQPYFPPPPFMPQLYPPYGFFPAGPGYHIGQPNPHGIPYGPPAPGFAFPPMHPFHSGHIANHAHPIPGAHGYPPNTNTGLGMRSYNQQPFQQASQQDGNRGESSTGGDRSDESFETSSSIDQQPTQSTSGQGADAPAAYRCSYCLEGAIPSKQQPLFFCPGCGPPCAIRYCGAGCLLADSWGHSFRCMRTYSLFSTHLASPNWSHLY